jgi:hypothetical protein
MQADTQSTSVVNRAEAEIAANYHAALQDEPGLAARSYEQLVRKHTEQGLKFNDRLLCNVLRPRFLSEQRLEALRRVSASLAALFERAGTHLLASDSRLDLVSASDDEREIWSIDPGYEGHTVTSRLDSFMVGDSPMFVEYNAESPASIGYCDVLSEIFLDLPVMKAWTTTGDLQRFHARRCLLESLLRAFHSWGGRDPSIAIVDWQDVATRRDFELCAEYFIHEGVPTLITDPRSFEYRDGTLAHNGIPVNLVYRRVLLHELLARKHEAEPLLRAYRDGAICLINNPRSKLLHKKGLFALLSDQTLGLTMSAEEREMVVTTLPWTRRLVSGETTYRGESTDLLRLLLAGQDKFTLKPVDDYGGRGVVLGWDSTEAEWSQALEGAVDRHFIVQERVTVPEAEFPVMRDGSMEIVPLMVDTDPLLFDGRLGGILTRISGSPMLNVTAGSGSTTPTFVVGRGDA